MSKENKFDVMIGLLREILKWIRFQGWKNVKEVLLDTLQDDVAKLVYHYSDGRSSRKIAEKVPVNYVTVTKYWRKWAKIGIVEPIKVKGGTRYKRIFSLEDFGIEIPEIKRTNEVSVTGEKLEKMFEI